LLVSAAYDASGVDNAGVTIIVGFLAGAAATIAYTYRLARRGRLFVRDKAEIARQRKRIARLRPVTWLLTAGLVVAIAELHGGWHVGAQALLAGFMFGFWPPLLANFLRLRPRAPNLRTR
jgi:hypothetical protein